MKLDELEKEMEGKTAPIPDTCRALVRIPNPVIPPFHRILDRLPKDAGNSDDVNMCKVTKFIPDTTDPTGYRREDTWVPTREAIGWHTSVGIKSRPVKPTPDSHLGGVEHVDLRHEYPYLPNESAEWMDI